MKKKNFLILGIVIMIGMFYVIISGLYINSGEHIPDCWPSRDKMETSLNKKGYDVVIRDVIQINYLTIEGERLTAEKDNEFIDAFWCVNDEALDSIDKFCSETHVSDYTLQVGYKIYCGTKKAIKASGIILQ